ncbi:GlcNAc-domain-containing protein, partial [Baffinella frigidus]
LCDVSVTPNASTQRQVCEVRVPHTEARGPCWARYLAQKLWNHEEYYLQIDSHMRFVEGWDAEIISQLKACPSDRPVLSTYPPGYPPSSWFQGLGFRYVGCLFGNTLDFGLIRVLGRGVFVRCVFVPGLFWAAGYSFSCSSLIKDVPYDPSLKNLFFGEEMTMLARMWTKGYDVFAPTKSLLFHLWSALLGLGFRASSVCIASCTFSGCMPSFSPRERRVCADQVLPLSSLVIGPTQDQGERQ